MSADARPPAASGPTLFYAYPPNERGSCGPPQHRQLFEYSVAQEHDPGLLQLAQQFAGAGPNPEFIAVVSAIPDPLDHRWSRCTGSATCCSTGST